MEHRETPEYSMRTVLTTRHVHTSCSGVKVQSSLLQTCRQMVTNVSEEKGTPSSVCHNPSAGKPLHGVSVRSDGRTH